MGYIGDFLTIMHEVWVGNLMTPAKHLFKASYGMTMRHTCGVPLLGLWARDIAVPFQDPQKGGWSYDNGSVCR